MSRYACGLSGCESDEEGEYSSLEDCKSQCQSVDSKVVWELILDYAPEGTLSLSPTDRVSVIKRLTGLTVPISQSEEILQAFSTGLLEDLAVFPNLWDYIEREYGSTSLRLALTRIATPEAYELWNEMARKIEMEASDYDISRGIAANSYYAELTILFRHAIDQNQEETLVLIIEDHGSQFFVDSLIDYPSIHGYDILVRLNRRGLLDDEPALRNFMMNNLQGSQIELIDHMYRSSEEGSEERSDLLEAFESTERDEGLDQEVRDWIRANDIGSFRFIPA